MYNGYFRISMKIVSLAHEHVPLSLMVPNFLFDAAVLYTVSSHAV